MNGLLELGLRAFVMGVAAAAVMDAWGFLLRHRFGVPTLDYALLGRWIGHLPRGRLFHERIAAADPIRGERPLGWLAHYAIGVAFAALLLVIVGLDWVRSPSIWPALAVGLGVVRAPRFEMQPGGEAGDPGSRTPCSPAQQIRNLATHTVYGLGLYAAAVALTFVSA
jgi:hypothetical protein